MSDKIRVKISEEELDKRIRELGAQISKEYEGEEVTLICILKGSVFFTCELAKRMTVPVKIEFMRCSSYGDSSVSSGKVDLILDVDGSIEGKNVIVIEDIVDTGRTLRYLIDTLKSRNPKSLKLAVLLNKPDRREIPVEFDYEGFVIPDEFVVGFGLDYAQKYRNLPYIGVVETE